MKKATILCCIVAIIAIQAVGQERFMLSVSGNMLSPADSIYKEVYGDSLFFPEFKLAVKFVKDFYLWVGYGFYSASGETLELKLPADSTQYFISFGAGYNGTLSKKLEYLLELGGFYVNYKEEALQTEFEDSAVGFRVDGSLIYRIGKRLFAGLTLGYLAASDEYEQVSIDLGGFKAGLLLGLKF